MKSHLALIFTVLIQTSLAQGDVGVQGGFVDSIKSAKSTAWLQQLPKYEKNRIIYYDENGLPAQLQAEQTIDLTHWCNYDANQIRQWKQEWDEKYKGKVSAGCASLYLEWQKARNCQTPVDPNAQWKPNIEWQGQGQKLSDLPNGNIDGLLAKKQCVGCQLDLVGLACLNLQQIDLSKSQLNRIDFYQSDLRHANLSATQLKQSVLTASDLSQANMVGIKIVKTVMANAIVANANLTGASLSHVDLQRADLKNTNFRQSTLRNVSLSNADLRGADFTDAILENVDLKGTNLSQTKGLYLRRPKP